MKKIKKIFNIAIFMLLIIQFLVPQSVFAKDNKSDIKINSIEVGYDKKYKVGYEVPIKIEVENIGKDFNGQVQVLVPTKDNNNMFMEKYSGYVAYSNNISIEANTKKTVTIYAEIADYISNLVRVTDGEKVIVEEKLKSYGGSYSDTPYIGVLTDNPTSMTYVKDAILNGNSKSTVINFTEKNLPDVYEGLRAFNSIIISNFDTSKLSERQYEALKKWVLNGGSLVLGTGENYEKTLSVFKDDFIVGEIKGSQKIDSDKIVSFVKGDDGNIPLNIASIKVDGMKIILEENKENPLIVKSNKNSGNIIIAAFDFSSNNISEWNKNSNLIANILNNNKLIADSNNTFYDNIWELPNILSRFSEINQIKIGTLTWGLLIYILLIFPGAYIILKKKDKKEKMWVVAPGIAVICSIAMIFYVKISGVNKIYATSVNFVNLNNNRESTQSLISLNNLTKKESRIESEIDIKRLETNKNQYDDGNAKMEIPNKIKATVNQDDNSLVLNDLNLVETNLLKGYGTKGEAGDISLEFKVEGTELIGILKNNTKYKLENAFIISNSGTIMNLESIEPNEVKEFNLNDVKLSSSLYNGSWDVINEILKIDRNQDISRLKGKEKEERINLELKASIYEILFRMQQEQVQNVGKYSIGAIIDNYETSPILVDGKEIKKYNRNTLFTSMDVKFDIPTGKEFELPEEFVNFTVQPIGKEFNFDNYNNTFYSNSMGEVIYSLGNEFEYSKVNINFSGTNSDYEIYNLEKGEYEKLEKDIKNKIINKESIKKYLDEQAQIKIKVKVSPEGEALVPKLSVKGVKR